MSDDSETVTAKIRIRCNATREIRTHVDENYDPSNDYQWTDGNYGCDCNRGLFFARAGGESDHGACGDTRYTCIDATLPDGRVVLMDEA